MSESNVTIIDFPEKSFTFNGNDYYDQDYWGSQQYTWTGPNGYTWKPRWSTVKRQYKISGLRPNSEYDFYVNGVKRNNCVGQSNLEAYEQNKADTSLSTIRNSYPYNGWYWGWWGWWGGWWGGYWWNNSNWKYLDHMLNVGDATRNDPMKSNSSGVVDFNFFSGLFAQQVHDHPGDSDVAKEYVEEALQELRSDYGMQITDQQFDQIVKNHRNSVDWWQSHNWWWWKGWWEMWWTMRGLSKMELVGPDTVYLPPPPDIQTEVLSSRTELIRVERTVYDHEYAPDQLASEVSLYFDWIQTFYLDSQLFESSSTATIYSINLYFLTRPGRMATQNVSGIDNPGCHIYICETQGGTPDLTKTYRTSICQLQYDDINAASDASLPTAFTFTHPLTLDTNKTYGIVVNFEDPNYEIAIAKSGKPLINDTGTIYTSNYSEGKLYRASNYGEVDNDPDTLDELYKPLNTSDLKFDINFCKFDTQNTYTLELVNDDYEFIQIQEFPLDYLDRTFSIQDVVYVDYGNAADNVFHSTGERYDYSQPIIVPQRLDNFSQSSGVTSITNQDGSTQYVENTADENAATGETLAPSRMEHGFVYNANQSFRSLAKANKLKNRMIKCENRIKVQQALIESNPSDKFDKFKNAIQLSFCIGSSIEPVTDNFDQISTERLTQTFMNVRLASALRSEFYTTLQSNGEIIFDQEIYITDVWSGIVENIDYSANTISVLSQNQSKEIGLNGIANFPDWAQASAITSYNPGDDIVVEFSQSGANTALISLDINSSGFVQSINIENPGKNFDSEQSISTTWSKRTFTNGTSPLLTGMTAPASNVFTFGTPFVGAYLVSAMTNVRTPIIGTRNISVDNILPEMDIQVRNAEVSNLYINYSIVSDLANQKYTLNDSNELVIENQVPLDINTYDAYVLSRTNELKTSDTLGSTTSEGKSSLVKFSIRTLNQWESPELIQSLSSIYAYENIVNNDSTLEETPYYGLADAKHISKQITFEKDRFAEDIRVISTMWKPSGTDVKFYARVHNSADEQAYEEKGWTLLEIKDKTLGKLYSSKLNKQDTIEFTYGFRPYPELNATIVGAEESFTITSNASKNNANTTFSLTGDYTSSISNNQVLVLYHPEFGVESDILEQQGSLNQLVYQVIRVANTPYYDTTNTLFEIDQDIANNSILALTDYGILSSVKNPYAVFLDSQDGNVAKYYTSTGESFSTYDTMAVKVVLLAETNHVVPQIEDIRAIAVSA